MATGSCERTAQFQQGMSGRFDEFLEVEDDMGVERWCIDGGQLYNTVRSPKLRCLDADSCPKLRFVDADSCPKLGFVDADSGTALGLYAPSEFSGRFTPTIFPSRQPKVLEAIGQLQYTDLCHLFAHIFADGIMGHLTL